MSFFEFPNTRTYDDDLGWLIASMKKCIDAIKQIDNWEETHKRQYEELKKLYDDVMAGKFPPSVTAAFNKWMRENALDLVGNLVNMVFFGLTDSGYFVAYIPESWRDLVFKTTGWDLYTELQPEYGHLIIEY